MTIDVTTGDTIHEDPHEHDDARRTRRTEQVRIVGAERAGDAVGHAAAATDVDAPAGAVAGHVEDADDDWGPEDWPAPAEPQLPHWTEAPTGEVPAVLSRGEPTERDPWASLPEPSWREERHEWEQEETLASSLLAGAGDEPSLLSEVDEEERQPWSFELDVAVRGLAADDEAGDTAALSDLAGGDLFGDRASPGTAEEVGGPGVAGGVHHPEASDGLDEAETPDGLDDIGGEPTGLMHLQVSGAELPAEEEPAEETGPPEGPRRPVPHPPPGPFSQPVLGRRVPSGPRAGDDALSQRTGRNIPAAVVSGVVIGGLALLAFHFGTVPSMVVVTAVLTAAAVEAFAAFRRSYRPATLVGIVAVAGVIVGSYDKPFTALPAVVVLLVAATFLWHLVGVDRRAEPVRSTAATVLVFCWVGVFGSFAALLLAPSLFPHRTGIAYLLGALIAAVAYDVGALVAGAWLGRHPLSAASPGKTWEGVLGGAVAAIVLAVVVVRLVHPWTAGEAVLLGVVVAVVSPLGDLCESLVKRHLGLKDMGRILPGHGGLLDRVDGLLFVLPATYYLLRAFGHG